MRSQRKMMKNTCCKTLSNNLSDIYWTILYYITESCKTNLLFEFSYSDEDNETSLSCMNNHRYHSTLAGAFEEADLSFFKEKQQHCRINYLQYPAPYTKSNMLTPVTFKILFTIFCFHASKGDFALYPSYTSISNTETKNDLLVYMVLYVDHTIEFLPDGSPQHIQTQSESYE